VFIREDKERDIFAKKKKIKTKNRKIEILEALELELEPSIYGLRMPYI